MRGWRNRHGNDRQTQKHGAGLTRDPAGLPEPGRLSLLDVIQLATLGIRSRRLRAALSTLGVAIGMATLVLVVAIPRSSDAALLARLSALGSNLLEAEAQPQNGLAVSFPPDAAAMAARIAPVTAAAELGNTRAVVRRSRLIAPATTVGLDVLASSANLLNVVSGSMAAGQFLSPATQRFPVAVLGHQAAASLGIDRPATVDRPERVLIGSRWFTVIGIAAPMPVTSDLDWAVLVGWNAARVDLGFNGRATVAYVRADADELGPVSAVLGPTLYPPAPGLVNVTQPSDALAAQRASQATSSGLLIGLAAVSLLVGGIGIANTMFVAVSERKQEIGLRRALGATRRQIRLQFLGEAITLSALGGFAGTTIGALAATGYALWEGWPPTVPAAVIGIGVLGATVVGALAGLQPATRAARLPPTEALASP
jgi:putative ABC transport system permease protein